MRVFQPNAFFWTQNKNLFFESNRFHIEQSVLDMQFAMKIIESDYESVCLSLSASRSSAYFAFDFFFANLIPRKV